MLGQKAGGVSGDSALGGANSDEEEAPEEEASAAEKQEEMPAEGEDEGIQENERIKMNLKNSSKIYYSITHTVQEEIKEQPKMIKGGTLKSY